MRIDNKHKTDLGNINFSEINITLVMHYDNDIKSYKQHRLNFNNMTESDVETNRLINKIHIELYINKNYKLSSSIYIIKTFNDKTERIVLDEVGKIKLLDTIFSLKTKHNLFNKIKLKYYFGDV